MTIDNYVLDTPVPVNTGKTQGPSTPRKNTAESRYLQHTESVYGNDKKNPRSYNEIDFDYLALAVNYLEVGAQELLLWNGRHNQLSRHKEKYSDRQLIEKGFSSLIWEVSDLQEKLRITEPNQPYSNPIYGATGVALHLGLGYAPRMSGMYGAKKQAEEIKRVMKTANFALKLAGKEKKQTYQVAKSA